MFTSLLVLQHNSNYFCIISKNEIGYNDVEYFLKKLYKALNVPASRLEAENGFNMGRSSEITRDELKFQKYPNVQVKLIPYNDEGENNLMQYITETKVFFGDEFTDTFMNENAKNETISFLNSLDFCWLTVSSKKMDKVSKLNQKKYIESWKPEDYNIIELKTPIRSTREIAKHLKENLDRGIFG